VTPPGYLRHPHVHGEFLTFVAEDDIWLAPADGLPGHELADGTYLTVPRYAFWFTELGWDVENHGVDPDVEVLNTPDDWAAGRDPQLETAVQLALEAPDKQPSPVAPDASTGPAKARPPLPPRRP